MPATENVSRRHEDFMTILARLEQWREQGAISAEQHSHLASLCRGEPFSLFLELNILLYAGVLAFVAGLGWTVTTWSQQLGDVLVLAILSAMLAGCFWYCFSRAPVGPSRKRLHRLLSSITFFTWAPGLVHRTRLPGKPFPPPLRTMGPLSPGNRQLCFSSWLIVSTIASCCLSLCPHLPDGAG